MIKFIGTGSAFNTELGNNSAFVKQDHTMLLIDCGGTVFHRLQQLRLLEEVKELYIFITHTHPDHIGSLGEVIFYCYYILNIRVNLFFPNAPLMKTYLQITGVTEEMYVLNTDAKVCFKENKLGLRALEWEQHTHVDTIPAYGFVLDTDEMTFYYSGDSNELSENIIKRLEQGEIHIIYQDTCGLEYENNAHLSLNKLSKLIQPIYRKRVYCMHLDKHICEETIKDLGFKKVDVTNVKKNNILIN